MAGKPYTLREMKSIVDYLVDHRCYNETRGRKMWVDFANSKLTTRTWQSLKETFLKRILPDITNVYYRLDPDQILSFKRGLDLTQKDKKLEFEPVNGPVQNVANGDNQQPSTSKNNNEEIATGEDPKCSKIVHDRASTETLVLDTCYQTAEDIQRDLESADEEQEKEKYKKKPALKSVRDYIEYSEPLTPMLQEVLDDFATDEECSDTEAPMQIDEHYVAHDETTNTPKNAASSQSILHPNKGDNQTNDETTGEKDNVEETGNEKQITKHSEYSLKPLENTPFSQLEDVMVLVDKALAKDLDKELDTKKIESLDKDANSYESSTLTDTLLPNNQEAVKGASTIEIHSSPHTPDDHGVEKQIGNEDGQEELNELNSKTHSISDPEQDKIGSEGPNTVDTTEEEANNVEQPTQKPESAIKPYQQDNKDLEVHSDSSTTKDVTSTVDNPCLKSVSLYAEELTTTKYSDSDSNNKENANRAKETIITDGNEAKEQTKDESKEQEDPDKVTENSTEKPAEDIILLHAHTSSESADDSLSNHRPFARSSLKMQKEKKLASVFGFSNGGASKNRRLSGRKRTISHRNQHSESSSDWTSASDSDFVSPPRGRRNKYARKYLKPHSARIMSLDEEGGLFVMLGKKVYPLVKDGKALKNYVSYLPESDPEEDDTYWKAKYIEERKRTAELKKKLGQTNIALDEAEKKRSISLSSPLSEVPPRKLPSRQTSANGHEFMRRDSTLSRNGNLDTLKIKFTTNNQEVQVEGNWQYINPVLAQVVSMLHKEPSETKKDAVTCLELSSGNTTPVEPNVKPRDRGVKEKINKIESEIFKEIEQHDSVVADEEKEDQNKNIPVPNEDEEKNPSEKVEENDNPAQNDNPVQTEAMETGEQQPQVTLRKKRGRPKTESTPTPAIVTSPAKKPKTSTRSRKSSGSEKATKINDSTPSVARLTRSPRKLLDGIPTKPKVVRKAKALLEPPTDVIENSIEDDDEVRYKFPSPAPETGAKSTNTNRKSNDSSKDHLPNITSPDSLSRHSINSSQGYQDSDASPFNIGKRKRRRLSISTSFKGRKMQRNLRSKSYPVFKLIDDESSVYLNSSSKIISKEQSTINSEVYKSDSYQLMMPRTRNIMKRLEKIDEVNTNENETNKIIDFDELLQVLDASNKNDPASSSNLSLPLSPELSIVENLSLSKNALTVINDPTINEIQSNDIDIETCTNKYRFSAIDVSMPLMIQDCAVQEKYKKHVNSALNNLSDTPNSAGRNLTDESMKISINSDSIMKNICTVNIENSDSLDRRLEQLLLESAQKPISQNRGGKMEVDTEVKKKSGSRKRCSTPHKKKSVPSKKKPSEEPIIEEEAKVRCSRGGRRSCPPSINIVYYEDNAPDNLEINIRDEIIDVTTVTKRKRPKKDIIKVKIGKPKEKKKRKSKSKTPDVSEISEKTGDNESGVFLQGFEDSGDLIHNHSETCLQIRDCMGDSVEFIETTAKSIISLSSSSYMAENVSTESGKTEHVEFCDNAQCATHLRDGLRSPDRGKDRTRNFQFASAQATEVKSVESGNTVYFTPESQSNSIITEDLSDELPEPPNSRPSQWYLLSDDESNTHYFDVQETRSYGSNLQQIFPITCAIPDLSTITEMSNSQKRSFD